MVVYPRNNIVIDPYDKSHTAPDKRPIMSDFAHFCYKMLYCEIFVWYIVGYETGGFWILF